MSRELQNTIEQAENAFNLMHAATNARDANDQFVKARDLLHRALRLAHEFGADHKVAWLEDRLSHLDVMFRSLGLTPE
ncbi:MAG: hypothetical protein KatS3mg105_3460 [Gemmatales bacterium]|nr:MAG: hypothetical protein KatS3mg105_3460 [Gemmatales bacterium]